MGLATLLILFAVLGWLVATSYATLKLLTVMAIATPEEACMIRASLRKQFGRFVSR